MRPILAALSLISFATLVACGSVRNPATPTMTETPEPVAVVSEKPSETPWVFYTLTALQTATSTAAPISQTQLPTLAPEAARETLLAWLNDNENCEFPCVWGIDPGHTSIEQALSQLRRIDSLLVSASGNRQEASFQWEIPDGHHTVQVQLYLDTKRSEVVRYVGLVAAILVDIEGGYRIVDDPDLYQHYLAEYTLPQLVSQFGQPANVYVRQDKGSGQYSLSLLWIEQGIDATFTGDQVGEGDQFVMCPVISVPMVSYSFWSPQDAAMSEELGALTERQLAEDYQDLERATGVSPEAFVQMLQSNNPSDCLTTPKDIWPER